MNRCLCLVTSCHDNGALTQQRYEPLPGLDQLPAWLWRRTAPWARVAIGVALAATIASTALLVPALQREQRARAAAEQQARDVRHRLAIEALKREQRPRFGRSAEDRTAGHAPRPRRRDPRRRPHARAPRPDPAYRLRAVSENGGRAGTRAQPARDQRQLLVPRRHERDRPQRHHDRWRARPSLPRESRLRHRALRPLQSRRASRSDPGPRGDHTPRLRRRAVARTREPPTSRRRPTPGRSR